MFTRVSIKVPWRISPSWYQPCFSGYLNLILIFWVRSRRSACSGSTGIFASRKTRHPISLGSVPAWRLGGRIIPDPGTMFGSLSMAPGWPQVFTGLKEKN